MITQGSWNARAIASAGGFPVGIAPTPIGPTGSRATVTTALGDSVWAGTKHPEEAKRLVAFLATPECQDLVAKQARVFPALRGSSELAAAAFADQGVDVSAFTVQQQEGTAVPSPVVLGWTRLQEIMGPTMDAFLAGADPDTFEKANRQVDAIFR
ncbi:extracellular solute-binding protein [Galbitalea sp. SE-J8]|nr:extracellular solute-binding protein [Galbitalea sp. SE-J8]MDM4762875.1 extracellular solute-binding protein [Galbitalea sp. SE-J8]